MAAFQPGLVLNQRSLLLERVTRLNAVFRAEPSDPRRRRLKVLAIAILELRNGFLVLLRYEAADHHLGEREMIEDRLKPRVAEALHRSLLGHLPLPDGRKELVEPGGTER